MKKCFILKYKIPRDSFFGQLFDLSEKRQFTCLAQSYSDAIDQLNSWCKQLGIREVTVYETILIPCYMPEIEKDDLPLDTPEKV